MRLSSGYGPGLEENLGAADVELTPDDLSDTEAAVSSITVRGKRCAKALEWLTGRCAAAWQAGVDP
jgi:hypothetical protein